MQFSIARLLLITLFVNFVLAATFALPNPFGYLILTFVSLFMIPPFIVVGVVNTRGIRQSFFLGAMITGIPHFIFCVYLAISIMAGFGDLTSLFDYSDEMGGLIYIHAIGYLFGAIGGGLGMAAFAFLNLGQRRPDSTQSAVESKRDKYSEKNRVSRDDLFESDSTEQQRESSGPEKREALPPR